MFMYPDVPETLEMSMELYDNLIDLWFEYLEENLKVKQSALTKVMEGAYYVYPITPNFSVVALNSLYWFGANSKQIAPGKVGTKQLDWFKTLL